MKTVYGKKVVSVFYRMGGRKKERGEKFAGALCRAAQVNMLHAAASPKMPNR
jgi:hypothetical protein